MSNPRKKVKFGLSMLIGILLIAYALLQSRNLIQGPVITVTHPSDGQTLTQATVRVTGNAHNISYINLNNRQIFVDDTGAFSETVLAPHGYSVIKLSVRDKFGETKEKIIRVNYPEESPPLPEIYPQEESTIENTEELEMIEG